MAGNFGKILGGGIGWAFGGPIGALLGLVVGTFVDSASENSTRLLGGESVGEGARQASQDNFFLSLLVLSAAVMKADGKKLRSELNFIKTFFASNFGEEKTKDALPTLKKLLDSEISLRPVCLQIVQYVNHSGRLQLMHYLYGIAAADGQVDKAEEAVLNQIGGYFNVSLADMAAIKAMFVKSTNWAFDVLEIDELATDDEVKKAYRRMATRFHPDKVSTLGDDAVLAAQQKFQKVQEAYEVIKKQRGIK